MDARTQKKLDRLLNQLERRANRPPSRFPTSPITLAIGLIMGHLLLTRLVPRAWAQLLPGGLDQAATLRGWPGLIWQAAVLCHHRETLVFGAIGVTVVVSFWLARRSRMVGILVWLASVGVILADAGIIAVMIWTSLKATSADAGIPLGL